MKIKDGSLKKTIEPAQIRAALSKSAQEYIKAPEYQKQTQTQFEYWINSHQQQLIDISNQINRQLQSSGFLQAVEHAQRTIQNTLGPLSIAKPESHSITFVPKKETVPYLSSRTIDQISEEVVRKLLERGAGPSPEHMTLVLTSDGDLYREPKNEHCYPIRRASKTLDLFNALTSSYKNTEDIAIAVGNNNHEYLRKALGSMNRKVMSRLDLTERFIESKAFSGYRINPFYRITRK